MKSMHGIWVPLVTPFRQGQVDLDAAQRLASHLVAKGIHGLVVCGTTGEACALEDGEQEMLLDAVLAAVGSDYPVMMGLCGSDTRSVVIQARRYSERDIATLCLGGTHACSLICWLFNTSRILPQVQSCINHNANCL